jgi:hypothetical protein
LEYAHTLYLSKHVNFDCNGETTHRYSVHAEINFGRWLARCPLCSRANYVDPADPIFYCFGCANQGTGKFVCVVFPEQREFIEQLILMRPVHEDETENNPISQAMNAHGIIKGLERNWHPDQSIADLLLENERIETEKQSG